MHQDRQTPFAQLVDFQAAVVVDLEALNVRMQLHAAKTKRKKMLDVAFLPGAERVIQLAKASGLYKGDL